MSDQRPKNLDTSAQNVTLPSIVEAAAEFVPVRTNPSVGLAPTKGRVAKDNQGNIYIADGSAWSSLTDTAGLDLAALPGAKIVRSADDLPDAEAGVRTLEDGTAYLFVDFVADPATLELPSNMPAALLGWHGGVSGYIHTGQTTALSGTNAPFLARDLTVSAPGATMFDLSADSTVEMLVESCNFGDPAGFGNITDMGTITGYRVPSFKGCNFEDFDSGLTFTGNPDKIFIESSPFRSVTASNVRVLEFDSGFDADVVDMANNYVKGMQPDTEVIYVDPDATIGEIFQYRGNTHDSSVTVDNILTGVAAIDSVDFRISDSYPLSNSKGYADYTLDADAVTTITTQATDKDDETAYVRVEGGTSPRGLARFEHADNLITYVGKRDRVAELQAVLSVGTGTADIVAAAWFANGSLIPGTATRIQMNQQGGGIAKTIVSAGINGNISTGDELDVRLANLGSTTDITVGELSAKIAT